MSKLPKLTKAMVQEQLSDLINELEGTPSEPKKAKGGRAALDMMLKQRTESAQASRG